jgi:signal transduction histidine kinase
MLSFSKDREPALEPADLNETVADVVELMQSRAAELNVALDWTPGCDLPQVQIDPDGIHRAVLNIVTNAIDAAENVDGARVTIATAYDAGNNVVQVTIADNGVGISESDLASIFQVFASTKGARGTGLGLPVSQKIVREHGGKIVVTSKPGQGSQFMIELPMKRPEPGKGSGGTREVPVVPG